MQRRILHLPPLNIRAMQLLAALVVFILSCGIAIGIAQPAAAAPTCGANQASYTVVAGDTLYNIAKRYGTTANQLQAQNGGSTTIKVGVTKLCVPAPATVPTTASLAATPLVTTSDCPAGTVIYTAVSGDTLFGISRKTGVSVDELRRQNGGRDDIQANLSTFCVPGSQPVTSAVVATSSPTTAAPQPPSGGSAPQFTCNVLRFVDGVWVYTWCDGAGFLALIRAVEAKGIKHHFRPPYANPQKGQAYYMSTSDGENGGEIIHVSFTGPNRGQTFPTPPQQPSTQSETSEMKVMLASVLAAAEPDFMSFVDVTGSAAEIYVVHRLIPAMQRQLEIMINESGLVVSATRNPLYYDEFLRYIRNGESVRHALELIDPDVLDLFNLGEEFEMAVVLTPVRRDRVQFWWASHFNQQVGGFNDWQPVGVKTLELWRQGLNDDEIDAALKEWFQAQYFNKFPPEDYTIESNAGPAAMPVDTICGPNYTSCDMGAFGLNNTTSCGIVGAASCSVGTTPKPGGSDCKGVSSCGSVKTPPVCGKAGDIASCKFPGGTTPSNFCNFADGTAACNPFGKPADSTVLSTS